MLHGAVTASSLETLIGPSLGSPLVILIIDLLGKALSTFMGTPLVIFLGYPEYHFFGTPHGWSIGSLLGAPCSEVLVILLVWLLV